MGRGVMTVPDATATAYQTFGPDESYYRQGFDEYVEAGWADAEDDFEDWMYGIWNDGDSESDWDSLKEWIAQRACEMWPSLTEVSNEWLPDGETRILAKNAHSAVTIAEYNGVVAISLVPHYDRDTYWRDDNALGEQWRKSIAKRFAAEFGEYEKIGTFSNGESVYQRAED